MGNNRGNYYSRRNTNLSPDDKEFWSWTWDEMGSKDIPAMVNYVLQKTGEKKIAYVGHSQGCTQALACFSSGCDAEFKKKISIFIALAPVATLAHVESTFIKVLANLHIDKFVQFLGVKEFLPSSNLIHFLVPGICDHSLLQKPVCESTCFVDNY
jgi:pimeloyl-ACP methyl ester carboxylesterase